MSRSLIIFTVILFNSLSASAETFRSSPAGGNLIELYTSEGCSSCPPADRWLSSLVNRPALFKTVFPVAFHVDYWNKLGWPDRFSSPEYTARQHTLSQQGLLSQVYTPGLVVNGKEWRGWFSGKQHWQQPPLNQGTLTLEVQQNQLDAEISQLSLKKPLLHVVYLGMGLETDVKRGENQGKRLTHDFVVLSYETYSTQSTHWNIHLPSIPQRGQQKTALVAWVSETDRLYPLQIAGGLLN